MSGSQYCYFHDPARKKDRLEASRRGGLAGKLATLPADAPAVKLKSADHVEKLLAETITQVRRGELAPQIANSVGYLVNIWAKIREIGDIEERLVKVEEALKTGGHGPV